MNLKVLKEERLLKVQLNGFSYINTTQKVNAKTQDAQITFSTQTKPLGGRVGLGQVS